MLNDWIRDARRDLRSLKRPECTYGYKKGARPSVEPSVLAWLGLLASGDECCADEDRAAHSKPLNGWRQFSTPTGRYPLRLKSRAPHGRLLTPSSSGAPLGI